LATWQRLAGCDGPLKQEPQPGFIKNPLPMKKAAGFLLAAKKQRGKIND